LPVVVVAVGTEVTPAMGARVIAFEISPERRKLGWKDCMKGVVFVGDRKLELRDFPDPTPGPRDAGDAGACLSAFDAAALYPHYLQPLANKLHACR
jgi:hypothetical protein